jgi:hypothetical protein
MGRTLRESNAHPTRPPQEAQLLNYFVYKNGKGNFWSPLTDKLLGPGRESVLYVGFDDHWRDERSSGPMEPRPSLLVGNEHRDMKYILFVSHEENRNLFLLLTFEKTELWFWRVVGEVRYANEVELTEAAKIERRPKDYDKYFPDPRTPRSSSSARLRVLPVKRIAKVPRSELYTSVDSLAVYQSLNRGTCSPLWRSNGPSGGTLTAIEPQRAIQGCGRVDLGVETPFAAFVRLYLNELLLHHCPGEAPQERLGNYSMDIRSARALVHATLNPILVETAAHAFVRDLGLTPDIGVGKGKDVVDVRSRAAANDGTLDRELAARALERLKALPHLELSKTLQTKLVKTGTLDIQCKAADRDAIVPGVLYFGFRAPEVTGPDILRLTSLDTLLSSGKWPELDRFLAMQAQILAGTWRL